MSSESPAASAGPATPTTFGTGTLSCGEAGAFDSHRRHFFPVRLAVGSSDLTRRRHVRIVHREPSLRLGSRWATCFGNRTSARFDSWGADHAALVLGENGCLTSSTRKVRVLHAVPTESDAPIELARLIREPRWV